MKTKCYDFTCYHCDEDFEVEAKIVHEEHGDWPDFGTVSGAPECPACGEPVEESGSHASDARSERRQMGIC
jgi:hypothetical protein